MFLIAEKKSAAVLESVDKRSASAIDSAQKLGDGYQEIAKSWEHRVEQLKMELDKKNAKIDELLKNQSEQSHELDRAHTCETRAKMMICDKVYCTKRRPPYGQGSCYDFDNPVAVQPDSEQQE